MEVTYKRCAGLDVHKKSVVASVRVWEGDELREETRSFGTMWEDLWQMADWLRAEAVTHVAMESTGVYWKPIFNVLEGDFEVWVVNAKHIKHVKGRKSDIKDAEWIAQLMQYGLLAPSFIPEAPQRELRELVRYRTHLIEERTREVNRVHKALEDANIKLSSVATDVMGVSGRQMLQAIIAGKDDPAALAQLAKGRMRSKIDELERALTGRVKDSHRVLLRLHLEHIDELNAKLEQLEEEIEKLLPPFDQDDLIDRLDTIPGVDRRVAQIIIAEIGVDMSRFPSADHLTSWAGLSPGQNESAGKNRSSRTLKANCYLRPALVQAAHAAGRTRNTYLGAKYGSLSGRRGKKRAAVAIARKILVIVHHIIREGTVYKELGDDYLDQRRRETVTHYAVRRLEKLGYKVTLEPLRAAA
jgi:transposase